MTDQNTLDAVLGRIAQIAGIASGKKSNFKESAFFVLAFAEWSRAENSGGLTPRDRKAMRTVAKAALALDTALQKRTREVENALAAEWAASQCAAGIKPLATPPSRAGFLQWLAWPRRLADLAGRTHRRQALRRKTRRGAPTGFRNQFAYEIATGLRKAASESGGRLTIDKTLGAGSLITALELCKPLFGSGFRIPSAMTLDRMIKKHAAPTDAKTRRSKKRKSPAKKPNS